MAPGQRERSGGAIALASDPLILFRIFNYPPQSNLQGQSWGVGEHTDYGLLAILKQDDLGGLQVKTKSGGIDAPDRQLICL